MPFHTYLISATSRISWSLICSAVFPSPVPMSIEFLLRPHIVSGFFFSLQTVLWYRRVRSSCFFLNNPLPGFYVSPSLGDTVGASLSIFAGRPVPDLFFMKWCSSSFPGSPPPPFPLPTDFLSAQFPTSRLWIGLFQLLFPINPASRGTAFPPLNSIAVLCFPTSLLLVAFQDSSHLLG